jgi:voltage-gated potassium channel Kch
MSASKFTIESSKAKRIESYDSFMKEEKDKVFSYLLFYPLSFYEDTTKPLRFSGYTFKHISFNYTVFHNVGFIDCTFNDCLLMSASFKKCEFIDCTFENTNTSKARFTDTLIDPDDFSENFDLKTDTNIAVGLYQSLYKNLVNECQPKRAEKSLYLMYRAENAHLESQFKRDKITRAKFWKERIWHVFQDITSGYGLKKIKIFYSLIVTIFIFSLCNYYFSHHIFKLGDVTSLIDSIYFTLVTLTTLGYGDIVPCTPFGKVVIMIEAFIGIAIFSRFLSTLSSNGSGT